MIYKKKINLNSIKSIPNQANTEQTLMLFVCTDIKLNFISFKKFTMTGHSLRTTSLCVTEGCSSASSSSVRSSTPSRDTSSLSGSSSSGAGAGAAALSDDTRRAFFRRRDGLMEPSRLSMLPSRTCG